MDPFKLIGALLALIAGLFTADAVVKKKTDKHIHEHVFEWWDRTRDKIVAWADEVGSENIKYVMFYVDEVVTRARKVSVQFTGVDKHSRESKITTETVSLDELQERGREWGIPNVSPGDAYAMSPELVMTL